jgi:tetratricopeptide (TPR) repeat protein
MNAGIARTPEEKAAFAALNAHHLPEAETRFQAMLDKNENDARAAAGMGFLRMQQNNFAAAISYLEQSEQNGFKDHSVVEGLATSRFWFTMGEASTAFNANELDVAAEKYKAALAMRPRSSEALNGLAGIYTKNQQYSAAADIYQQILKIQPASLDGWRGLFLSYARNNLPQQAMAVMGRFPASVKASLNRDPDFLQTLASMYQATGKDADAQKILAQALALPFPDNGSTLKSGTRLQYAGILMAARRYDQAAELYKQVLAEETANLPAWMGLVTADHQLGHDNAAIELVEKMPPDTYEQALADPGFLAMLGSIYQQSNQFEIAQGLLERSVRLQIQAGGVPALGLQIQLASIYLQRNNTAEAYSLYHQILEAHPDNLDAWRGLIGTMQATHRDAEALQEIKLIPPAIRKQLETDVQFEQSEASLYANAGDTVNAIAIFNNVQKHYAALHQKPPADVEIQSAYLLYNTFNDRALYPALMSLGAREDLTNAQRETIQGLWANWSTRRAATAFDNGNTAGAIDILDAAAQAFPDNLTVRKAVAGGYLRVGRSKEALAMFKQIDLQDATAGDFQGAIGAALAANDKAQAEQWLRQALDRYPRDSTILGEAARFEQARGDNARAADYWRASLAAMPQVSPTDKLAHELVHPEAIKPNSRAATPDDLAHLLNPDQDAAARGGKSAKPLPPLPAYGHDPYDPGAPVVLSPRNGAGPGPDRMPVYPVPTRTTTPLPASEINPSPISNPSSSPSSNPVSIPGTGPSGQIGALTPQYNPQSGPGSRSGSGSGSDSNGQTGSQASSRTPVRPSERSQPAKSRTESNANKKDSSPVTYSGRMHLPPTEDTISSAGSGSPRAQPGPVYPQMVEQRYQQPAPRPKYPKPTAPPRPETTSTTGLRLSSEPLNPLAARAQALLTDETDAQLTQGIATGTIRYLPNAGSAGASIPGASLRGQTPESNSANLPGSQSQLPKSQAANNQVAGAGAYGLYSNAQYTPSAQDAAAGAYSVQKPVTPPQPQPETPQPPAAQPPAAPLPQLATKPTRKKRKAQPAANENSVPTLVTAPGESQGPAPQLPVTDANPQGTQSTSTNGLSDEELQERNLPPLKGPWVRLTHPQTTKLSPREEAELQLRTIEGGYSAWLGGTGNVAYRTGDPGYNSLSTLESAFEASTPLWKSARVTFIAKPVFLDSGQANGNAVIQLTTGAVTATSPEPIGTLTGTAASTTPPAQQNSSGVAGEVQLTFGNLAVAGGYTPYGFLISNWTARANWRPGGGPFTFSFSRDSVKDTQLSYSGLRDPGSISAFNPGNVWGGVMSDQGNVQFSRGDLASGFYAGAGGQYLSGYHVQDNKRADGSLGAYWRVLALPEYGSLNVGANFFAMHYTYNLQGYSYGMGGYFSPQFYFLANVPITWTGHHGTRWHYTVLGSFGIQAFSEDAEPLDPLDVGIETNTFNNAKLAALTSVGPNYDIRAQSAYAISDHWFVGGFAGANNSRNYTNLNIGFSVRYLFRSQPSTVAGPTGLFQTDDAHQLRPLTVP